MWHVEDYLFNMLVWVYISQKELFFEHVLYLAYVWKIVASNVKLKIMIKKV